MRLAQRRPIDVSNFRFVYPDCTSLTSACAGPRVGPPCGCSNFVLRRFDRSVCVGFQRSRFIPTKSFVFSRSAAYICIGKIYNSKYNFGVFICMYVFMSMYVCTHAHVVMYVCAYEVYGSVPMCMLYVCKSRFDRVY